MRRKALSRMDGADIKKLVNQIPFLKDLSLQNHQQLTLLLGYSSFVELAPKEVVIQKGSSDAIVYFLLKGKLDVFSDEVAGRHAIGQLTQGQIVGALSIVNDQPRIATLIASGREPVRLLAIDFTALGDFNDFGKIHLTTKISLLRVVVYNIRWKIEANRVKHPDHAIIRKLEKAKKFTGLVDTIEELDYLAEQAFFLGQLLDLWNDVAPAFEFTEVEVQQSPSTKERILSFFTR